ncbi:MAG TPA: DinB family protein [Holophagaceae bacterium]|nr:DinB family protein [Holophagaceae bacterium]
MIDGLTRILVRDLETLDREVGLYPDDASLWIAVPGQPTPGGNLALHLCGNLRHFIGATLGDTGYVRNREQEFAASGLSREAVRQEVARALADVRGALQGLQAWRLEEDYPLEIQGVRLPLDTVLMHLSGHLAFHLGQVDYHRRAATGDRTSAAPLALAPLESR